MLYECIYLQKGSNYREAYIDIETFMEYNGFEHRQWSGYISKYEMSTQDIQMIVINMGKTFPWLGSCVKKFDVTDIGQQHDLTELIKSCSAHMKSHENIKLFLSGKIAMKPHVQTSQC